MRRQAAFHPLIGLGRTDHPCQAHADSDMEFQVTMEEPRAWIGSVELEDVVAMFRDNDHVSDRRIHQVQLAGRLEFPRNAMANGRDQIRAEGVDPWRARLPTALAAMQFHWLVPFVFDCAASRMGSVRRLFTLPLEPVVAEDIPLEPVQMPRMYHGSSVLKNHAYPLVGGQKHHVRVVGNALTIPNIPADVGKLIWLRHAGGPVRIQTRLRSRSFPPTA